MFNQLQDPSSPPLPLPKLSHKECFAKPTTSGEPGISVLDHSLITVEIARRLIKNYFIETLKPVLQEGLFLIAAHDVGKISPGFLKNCSNKALEKILPELAAINLEARGLETHHSGTGYAAFKDWIGGNKNIKMHPWGKIIGAHHGTLDEPKGSNDWAIYGGKPWAEERKLFLSQLETEYKIPRPQNPPTPLQNKLVTGLTCISDWIASNEDFFPHEKLSKDFNIPKEVINVLDNGGWKHPKIKKGLTFQDIFPKISKPNSLQNQLNTAVKEAGVYIIEAPMGMGKTEAALFAAYQLLASGKNQGLYFALPTRLTSNKIHKRVENFLNNITEDNNYVKLAHGHSWMESRIKEFQAGMEWFLPAKRSLLTPFAVGTLDQALFSILKVKHNFVRTIGLAGKVVILDEVHSYDAYTGTLLNKLIEELRSIGCSVLILSATLTTQRRKEFIVNKSLEESNAYPLITTETSILTPEPPQDHPVKLFFSDNDLEGLTERAIERAENGECVLWIANTVAKSQEIFNFVNALRKENSFETGLLHSRFPPYRRNELENNWVERLGASTTNRPQGCILVATQVIEQSVDIDADLLITELAPTDMLLQRMGRLWRHQRSNRPCKDCECWIFGPQPNATWKTVKAFKEALGKSQYVYAPYVLWKTLQVWKDLSTITLPKDIRPLIETTYDDNIENSPSWCKTLYEELIEKRETLENFALGSTKIYCNNDDETASTRYSECPTFPALLLQDCDDLGCSATITLCNGDQFQLNYNERDFKKAKALHQNIVSLPGKFEGPNKPKWIEKILREKSLIIFKVEDQNLKLLDGTPTLWGYHPDLGVFKNEKNIKPSEESPDEFDW